MNGFVERRIFDVLAAGREEATENSNFLVDFFCSAGLQESEAEELRTFWDSVSVPNLKDATKPFKGVDIIHQYPRGPNVQFPCWAIVLMNEGEISPRFIGDEVDDFQDENGLVTGSGLGSFWKATYSIYTYAQLPDLCIAYYELCRFFLTRGRDFLKDSTTGADAVDTSFSGADMAPDPRYHPENMFVRRFTVELTQCRTVENAVQEGRGTKISGVHVAPNPESQITGVNPKVTVIDPTEDTNG